MKGYPIGISISDAAGHHLFHFNWLNIIVYLIWLYHMHKVHKKSQFKEIKSVHKGRNYFVDNSVFF